MFNKTPIKNTKNKYVSETRFLYQSSVGIPLNSSDGKSIIVPIGEVDTTSLVEIEATGQVFNDTGVARALTYSIGPSEDGLTLTSNVNLTEQVTMANSGTLFSIWDLKVASKLIDSSKAQTFRTVTTSSVNTQVTLNSLGTSNSGLTNKNKKYSNLLVGLNLNFAGNHGTYAIFYLKVTVTTLQKYY